MDRPGCVIQTMTSDRRSRPDARRLIGRIAARRRLFALNAWRAGDRTRTPAPALAPGPQGSDCDLGAESPHTAAYCLSMRATVSESWKHGPGLRTIWRSVAATRSSNRFDQRVAWEGHRYLYSTPAGQTLQSPSGIWDTAANSACRELFVTTTAALVQLDSHFDGKPQRQGDFSPTSRDRALAPGACRRQRTPGAAAIFAISRATRRATPLLRARICRDEDRRRADRWLSSSSPAIDDIATRPRLGLHLPSDSGISRACCKRCGMDSIPALRARTRRHDPVESSRADRAPRDARAIVVLDPRRARNALDATGICTIPLPS